MLATAQAVLVAGALLLGAEPQEPLRQCGPAHVAATHLIAAPDAYTPSTDVVDNALFSLYLPSDKTDWIKVRTKVRAGKRTRWKVTYKQDPYGWKDPAAAERMGMSLKNYLVGGEQAEFKRRLYCMLAAAQADGHDPVITSLFRDDWRQSIATGKKARTGDSFHGGSRRGGYGKAQAADVSVRGNFEAKLAFWGWVDKEGWRFGLGRPYGKGDQPHVAPTDGPEYLARHSKVAKVHKKGRKKTRVASRR